jgi:hypothetical protein
MAAARTSDMRRYIFFWAAAFVGGGLLLLVFNIGLLTRFAPLGQYIIAGAVGIAALACFGAYIVKREHWWRLIPGWTLAAFAAMVLLTLWPEVDRRWIGTLPLIGLAVAFINIYLLRRSTYWWAIMPAGFMLVLGVVIVLSGWVERLEVLGAVLFVGMGLVFFILYILADQGHQWWTLIPATVLLTFGVFVFTVNHPVENVLLQWWPLLLVLIGAGLVWRGYMLRPQQERLAVNVAPSMSRPRDQPVEPLGVLGEYSEPAPGASVELIAEPDEVADSPKR